MKNLLLIFIFVFPFIGYAQQIRTLITPKGSMIFETSQDKILVQFKKEVSTHSRSAWERKLGHIHKIKAITNTPINGLKVVEFKQSSEIKWAIRELQSPDIASIRPFLIRDGVQQAYHHKFIVKLKRSQDLKALQSDCRSLRMVIEMKNEFSPLIYHLKAIDEDVDVFDLSNIMNASGKYAYVMPDFLEITTPSVPNDPLLPGQWAITRDLSIIPGATWGPVETHTDMQVLEAWQYTTGSADIKIAVLDDGVQLDHPDLAGNLLPGRDFTGNSTHGGPFNTYDNHGTSCAGIIAAVGNNGLGITGVAYTSKIIPVKIAVTRDDGSWISSASAKINAINWAAHIAQADILSCSWGNNWNPFLEEAIDSAVSNGRDGRGCLLVFATGNQNLSNIPANHWTASYSKTIGVGATNQCDQRKNGGDCGADGTWGSNYGVGISVAAPGTSILTTHYNPSGPVEFDYHEFDGTSAATPHVAGVLALMLSTDYYLHWNRAKSILEKTCDKVGSYAYANQTNGLWCNELGYGRVNAVKAVMTVAHHRIRLIDELPFTYCPTYNSKQNGLWIEHFQFGEIHATGNDYGYGDHVKIELPAEYGRNNFVISTSEVDMESTSWNWGFSFIRQFQIWIDFNGDLDFDDPGESVFDTSTSNTLEDVIGYFNIPAEAPPITTRMRVRLQYDAHSGFLYPLTPCQITGGLEVEDYSITISPDSMVLLPLCTAPDISSDDAWIKRVEIGHLVNESGNNQGYLSSDKSDLQFQVGHLYPVLLEPDFKTKSTKQIWSIWMDTNRDGKFTSTEMTFMGKSKYPLHTDIYIPSQTNAGPLRLRVIMHPSIYDIQDPCSPPPKGEIEDYTINLVENMSYCGITGNTFYEYIKSFSLNGNGIYLGNDGSYRNLVPQIPPFNLYHQNDIVLEPGFVTNAYPEYWNVYIDLDADGAFEKDEKIVTTVQSQTGAWNGQFYLDQNAIPGKTTLRIIMSYYSFDEACGEVLYGDIVDVPVFLNLENQIEQSLTPPPEQSLLQPIPLDGKNIHFSVYPNPATDWLTIKSAGRFPSQSSEILIFDMHGNFIIRKKVEADIESISIPIADLLPGVYLVRFSGNFQKTRKFVKI